MHRIRMQMVRHQWKITLVNLSSIDYSVINEYLRFSSFEPAYIHCESGALSTNPLPHGILTSCTQ